MRLRLIGQSWYYGMVSALENFGSKKLAFRGGFIYCLYIVVVDASTSTTPHHHVCRSVGRSATAKNPVLFLVEISLVELAELDSWKQSF